MVVWGGGGALCRGRGRGRGKAGQPAQGKAGCTKYVTEYIVHNTALPEWHGGGGREWDINAATREGRQWGVQSVMFEGRETQKAQWANMGKGRVPVGKAREEGVGKGKGKVGTGMLCVKCVKGWGMHGNGNAQWQRRRGTYKNCPSCGACHVSHKYTGKRMGRGERSAA